MPPRSFPAALAAAAALVAPAGAAAAPMPVELDLLGRFGSGVEAGAEIADYHAGTRRVFVTNAAANRVDVYDVSNPAVPVARPSIPLEAYGATPNSVSVSADGIVAVAEEADPKTDPGLVVFFDVDGAPLGEVAVGAQPDMLTFTPDDRRVVVANEGEPAVDEDAETLLADPPGSISIVVPPRPGTPPSATTLGFEAFDASPIPGAHLGVPGVPFSIDAEPEYVAVAPDSRTAWVTLQERNAVAKVDLVRGAITSVTGLGRKDHALAGNALDPSDRDGAGGGKAIAIAPRPVLGMYQPDAIAAYEAGGRTWLVTANEGDAREWPGYLVEEQRVKSLTLESGAFPDAAALRADAVLGRQNVSSLEGRTGAGAYGALHAFGARSMSVLDAGGAIVDDTGDGLERLIAERQPELFNAEESDPSTWDERSDNKGPEPEGVATGELRGRPFAFLALERAGAIVAYDLGVPGKQRLAGFAPARAEDRAPEGIAFIAAEDSPNGRPLVMATYEVSGTVALYEVRGRPPGRPVTTPRGR